MPHIAQLPSGLWRATVYTPTGRRTQTHELAGWVEAWAADLEAEIRRGEFIDPRKAKATVGYVWRELSSARRLEKASWSRDRSMWKNWVEPRWGRVPVGSILNPDVQSWVNELEKGGVGGWTIIASVNLLRALLKLAVKAGMIRANPAREIEKPVPPKHVDRVLTADEETLILDRLDELFPQRRDARLFVEGLLETGTRWEELAAVRREAVDLRAGLVHIGPVRERDGTTREYPKGARSRDSAGFRPVPVGDAYLAKLRTAVMLTPAGEDLFPAPMGGPLLYTTWRRRVWAPALRVPVEGSRGDWTALVADPQPTPHDCRHTYGTRLADANLPQHERMALMGHADERSARRYAHAGDSRFDAARQALAQARLQSGASRS
jgi:integrase